MNPQQTKLFTLIDTAYNDVTVQQIPELTNLLMTAAQDLQNGTGTKMVATRLAKAISQYTTRHTTTTPAALMTLYQQIVGNAEKFKGAAISSFFL